MDSGDSVEHSSGQGDHADVPTHRLNAGYTPVTSGAFSQPLAVVKPVIAAARLDNSGQGVDAQSV